MIQSVTEEEEEGQKYKRITFPFLKIQPTSISIMKWRQIPIQTEML